MILMYYNELADEFSRREFYKFSANLYFRSSRLVSLLSTEKIGHGTECCSERWYQARNKAYKCIGLIYSNDGI